MRRPGRASTARAFSLLEVMVAIAILGLVLTVILSAQGGVAASNKSASNLGFAGTLARCKMTEAEEKLLKLGFPVTEVIETEVSCCQDADRDGFLCDTKVQAVELPNLQSPTLDGGLGGIGGGGDGGSPLGTISDPTGPLAMLSGGITDGGMPSTATLQQAVGGAGADQLFSMVMEIVYPAYKPMMEASIRKITVTVRWKEGSAAKELPLVQYVTNPQMGGFIDGFDGGAPVSTSGTTGTGTGGTGTGGTGNTGTGIGTNPLSGSGAGTGTITR